MSNTAIEKAIQQMEAWASDNTHGYDQIYRWGEKGDYDCSAAVIQAWENAGVPVKSKGATYTGNMFAVFLRCGFVDVTGTINLATGEGLKRGDVLLNHVRHTAMYCGNGWEVEASINEKGTATGGVPGDQTGAEFLKRKYRNLPWNCVLRYYGANEQPVQTENHVGRVDTVAEVQLWANSKYGADLEVDGEYGKLTKAALTKALQKIVGVNADGEFGIRTYTACMKLDVQTGNTGEIVSVLQALLVCNGYPEAYVDGDFGTGTEAALIAYQKAKGLVADGVAGQKTFKALCG